VDFSEISPHIELIDPISDESSLNLAPILPISHLSSPLLLFLPSLGPLDCAFIESETSVHDIPYLVQTLKLDDIDIERLKDHFEVKNLTLGHPMSFDFHIASY